MHKLLAALALLLLAGDGLAAVPRIVLIGGAKSEGPARHDYPNGVRVLKEIVESSPDLRGRVAVEAHPHGWPADPAALEGAATVVWYFDGLDRHPLHDAVRGASFERLMARGAGLVALHQASTVPAGDTTLGLERWLGAARHGMYDRASQDARLHVASPRHPVSRGLRPFDHHDEFYPTFRRAKGGRTTALLQARLRAEYRGGRELADDAEAIAVVAWAHERPGGGRAFAFSGGHHLASFDEPALRTLLLNAIAWTARLEVPAGGMRNGAPDIARRLAQAQTDTATFHRDALRSGWNPHEGALTPARVAAGPFGLKWETSVLDGADGQPPRLYASPLYVDRVKISAGPHAGRTFSVVIAATSAGFVYAINAFGDRGVPAGSILWRTRLAPPCRLEPAPLDGVPTGVLSTPVIDLRRGVLYVTHCDPESRWQAYALEIGSGKPMSGWPVRLDEATLNAVNRNAGPPVPPRRRFDFRVQRAALSLSPDGAWLHVGFGETETGWLASVDTRRPRVASAFATQAIPHRGSGGIWGAGGPAVDERGHVYVVTGTGYGGFVDNARDWTQSVLELAHDSEGRLELRGTYTPFNHCASAAMDIDLGSGGASLPPGTRLLVVGGKQGNAYLLDRERLPGRLDRRPGCSDDPGSDASFLPPQPQPQFGRRGPLNVFGPYSEKDAAMDTARARSVPAYFRDAAGRSFVFMTGSTRAGEGSTRSVAPSLVRLEITDAGAAHPHLRLDQAEMHHALQNPGSPLVTSNGGNDAIVWVLDENAPRSASLAEPSAPRPVLYAFEAMSLRLLWKSAPGELGTSGKYNQPAVSRGTVFVGTDRIQAFGLGGRAARASPEPPASSAAPPAGGAPAVSERATAAALYAQRCARCHDDPQGSIPPRSVIAERTRDRIVEVLSSGAMRPHAEGLDAAQIEALAEYLR